jgi:hypothetical protein
MHFHNAAGAAGTVYIADSLHSHILAAIARLIAHNAA